MQIDVLQVQGVPEAPMEKAPAVHIGGGERKQTINSVVWLRLYMQTVRVAQVKMGQISGRCAQSTSVRPDVVRH